MNPTQAASRIFCALDTADAVAATAPADKLEAIGRGADMLVIGRPITKADYPVDAARRMAQEIAPEGAETTRESG